ncbi:hypothetical protein BDB00DRAFT_878530 [Zychaea mexicana]|uniref:uncharacterized protein n=1 Tax=Zychaea mexicana TaxID=64656 RepID=UPI0022FE73A9|nr:uncharacterized protein BDB00DRAFT_878530 [Zychaea mexicana]KAI9484686.1 hypothetical protein BDB00DRAFT_878530 [Zychaea mexicana]
MNGNLITKPFTMKNEIWETVASIKQQRLEGRLKFTLLIECPKALMKFYLTWISLTIPAGRFKIVARIGSHAYKLNLPVALKIHPAFHVALLAPRDNRRLRTFKIVYPHHCPCGSSGRRVFRS